MLSLVEKILFSKPRTIRFVFKNKEEVIIHNAVGEHIVGDVALQFETANGVIYTIHTPEVIYQVSVEDE